jgi:di/tricarboxylate transporter
VTSNVNALIILFTLAATFSLFIWNRWRYDIVSLATLLFLTIVGIIPIGEAFVEFGHPAVVTVVAVLIISRGLQNSGLLDYLSNNIARDGFSIILQLLMLCFFTAFLSAFINNIGAMAVVLPVVLKAARQKKISPSLYLMPVAFSSLLGGLTTLIGTPPNIIVSTFRAEVVGTEFYLFDYSFVGLPVAIVGILFLATVGWRIVPIRRKAHETGDQFDIGDYTTEVVIPKGSKVIGKTFSDLKKIAGEGLILLVHASKEGERSSTNKNSKLKSEDVLVIEGPPAAINNLLDKTDLQIESNRELKKDVKASGKHLIGEAILLSGSPLVGGMPRAKTLRQRFGVALIAVARQGRGLRRRFSQVQLRTGDILLLRGEEEDVDEMMQETRCLPLAPRDIRLGLSKKSYLTLAIFLVAMGLVLFRLLPPQVAFAIGAVLMVAGGIVTSWPRSGNIRCSSAYRGASTPSG